MNALDQVTKYWTVARDPLMCHVRGMLGTVCCWIAVSIGIFIFGYLRFSFHDRKQKAKIILKNMRRLPTCRSTTRVARTYTPRDVGNSS